MADIRRVVEVRTSDEGSGFLISNNLVLTSWHVVRSACETSRALPIKVRINRTCVKTPNQAYHEVDANCIWPPEYPGEDLDFALLKIAGGAAEGPNPTPVELLQPIEWGPLPSWGEISVTAVGFPDLAIDVEKNQRDTKGLIGRVSLADNHRALSQNSGVVSIRIRDEDTPSGHATTSWPAMSGAAVFFQSTLIGLVKSVESVNGRHVLHALPVGRLFDGTTALDSILECGLEAPIRTDLSRQVMEVDDGANIEVERERVDTYLSALESLERPMYGSFALPETHSLTGTFVSLTSTFINLRDQTFKKNLSLGKVLESLENSNQPKSIFIEGAPGAGKSTLLRYLALNAWHRPRILGLKNKQLPLYIKLSCLSQSSGATASERLWNALTLNPELIIETKAGPEFLRSWSHLVGANWLILLDGFDEVPSQLQPGIQQWVSGLLDLGFNVIVTSRPSVGLSTNFIDRFSFFRLEPLSEDGQRILAERICGETSSVFLEQLARIASHSVRETPLLLTIAAVVYLSEGKLPEQRLRLYGKFLDIIKKEAMTRGLLADLPEDLSTQTDLLLNIIAYNMTVAPDETSIEGIASKLATSICEMSNSTSVEYSRGPAEVALRALSKHLGLFLILGDDCVWSHATFREFLVARLLSEKNEPDVEGKCIAEAWQDDRWRQIVRMWFSLRSFVADIDGLIERALAVTDEYGFTIDSHKFVSEIVTDGAEINSEIIDQMVELLCDTARRGTQSSMCARLLDPKQRITLEALSNLLACGYGQSSVLRLRSFMKEYLVEFGSQEVDDVRVSAFDDLEDLGGYEELFDVGVNKGLDASVRAESLRRVPLKMNAQEVDEALIYLLSVENKYLPLGPFGSIEKVSERLIERGKKSKVLEILADEGFSGRAGAAVVSAFLENGIDADFSHIVNTTTLDGRTRFEAAFARFKAIASPENTQTLLRFLSEGVGVKEQHEVAISEVCQSVGTEALAGLLRNDRLDIDTARLIVKTLPSYDGTSDLVLAVRQNLFSQSLLEEVLENFFWTEGVHKISGLKEWLSTRLSEGAAPEIVTICYAKVLMEELAYNEALQHLKAASGGKAWTNWASESEIVALIELGKCDDAMSALSEAIDNDPEYHWAYGTRAFLRKEIGDLEGAKRDFDICFSGFMPLQCNYSHYGELLVSLGRFDEAREAFETALTYGVDSLARRQLADCSFVLLDWSGTIERLEPLLEQDSVDTDVRLLRASAFRMTNELEAALGDYDIVLNEEPSNPIALEGRAIVNLRLGDVSKAREDIDRLKGGDSAEDWIMYLEGCAKAVLGFSDQAEKLWREALTANRKRLSRHPKDLATGNEETLWIAYQGNGGLLHCAVGEFDRGLDCFKELFEFDQTHYTQRWCVPELWDLIDIRESSGEQASELRDVFSSVTEHFSRGVLENHGNMEVAQ